MKNRYALISFTIILIYICTLLISNKIVNSKLRGKTSRMCPTYKIISTKIDGFTKKYTVEYYCANLDASTTNKEPYEARTEIKEFIYFLGVSI